MPKPIPVPDEISKPFWDACNQHQLIVQRCTACNKMQFPPAKACAKCNSPANLEWVQTSGRGKILGHLVVYDSRIVPLHPDQPFNLAVIALDDDPTINFPSNLPGRPLDDVPAGASVQVEFEEVAPGQLFPEWRVVEAQPRPAATTTRQRRR